MSSSTSFSFPSSTSTQTSAELTSRAEMTSVNPDIPTCSKHELFVNDNIRLTDSDGKYSVYHYNQCDEKDNDTTKQSRGIVRDVNGEIVCKTFNFTPEYVGKSDGIADTIYSKLQNSGDVHLGDRNIYLAEEGTLVRVWFHNNIWNISSHKKLNAFHSRWGSRETHGQMFREAIVWYIKNRLSNEIQVEDDEHVLDAYLSTLRRDRIYTYIVRSTQKNRIVCNPLDHPILYFAGEFDNNWILLSDNTSRIDRPQKLSFQSIADMLNYSETIDPFVAQGLMIYYGEDTSSFGVIKVTSSAYQALADVRGNVPSIRFRYLQVRNDSELKAKLLSLYPEYASDFQAYEDMLLSIRDEIYKGYLDRFIARKFTVLPQEMWYVAKDLHDLYIVDPVKNKISQELVMQHMNSLSAVRLNYLIRKLRERSSVVEQDVQNEADE